MPNINAAQVYSERLDAILYSADVGLQYNFINSLIRSVLQSAAFSSLDYCHACVDDIEQTDLPQLAAALLTPSDGNLGRLLDLSIPLIQQSGWAGCSAPWFKPTSDFADGQKILLNRRVETWVKHRNNRPGHGVVSQDVVVEAMTWLPRFSRALIEGLRDLMPVVTDTVSQHLLPPSGKPFLLTSWRLHAESLPIVVRSISPRGASWRVDYQVLDAGRSEEGAYELAPNAPVIALTRLEQELYRSYPVTLPVGEWKPYVLLPARQTPVFVGRTAERNALAAWMDDTDTRSCNVFGDGGIGKTTLVLEYFHGVLSGQLDAPAWRPEIICFYSAKETRWGPDGLERLRGAVPAIDDAAREAARAYEERLDRTWFEGDSTKVIDRAAGLLGSLGLNRDKVLIILDNAETLGRSTDEVEALGKALSYMAKKLGRVLVTSRRRESFSAQPIEVHPMSEDEGLSLFRQLAVEHGASALNVAKDKDLRAATLKLGGRPLLIDVVARLVGKFGYHLDRGIENSLRLASGDLGIFLYEDAWSGTGDGERSAFLVIGQLGGSVSGDLVGWACAETTIAHSQVLNALDKTRFGVIHDYGAHYDLVMDPSARAFLTQKYSSLEKDEKSRIDRAVTKVQGKYHQWLKGHQAVVSDRVVKAFRTDAAKAAHLATQQNRIEEAVRWFEEAVQSDRGNAALLDRFAWLLMKQVKDLPRALQVSKEACAADPNDADAAFTAGMIHARMADVTQSDTCLKLAEALGKSKHLCALQRAGARYRAIEGLFGKDPIDLERVDTLLKEARRMVQACVLATSVTSLDAKHEAERIRTDQRLDRLSFRADAIRAARARNRGAK